ncbi:unnamed protein product [Cladocopium goreaui]|uniref:40S ribosomal protein S8 n=1 Tax=Cladocopium goreaui TaxID=2562237 RepID=A0A9P1C4N9_9DINO|nr:unnamed protein product [Cladocopium goreaui]
MSMSPPSSPGFRSEFRQLRAALLQLREEHCALLDCLVDLRLLRPETFSASMHRRRFEAALKSSPQSFEKNLLDVLEEPAHIALQSARYGGQHMMTALKATCRSMAHKLSERAPAIQEALTWLYVCGGSGHQQQVRSSVERLDPSTGHWEALPAMAQRRFGSSSAVLDGCLYVCGGSEDQQALNSAERFNPARGAWEALPSMLLPRIHSSALAAHGQLFLCGGHNPSVLGIESIRACECYNPRLERWLPLPDMPNCRMAASLAELNGVLHVCGGFNGREALSNTERLLEDSTSWQELPPMSEGRFWASAAVLQNFLIVCSGNNGQQVLLSTERFDPVACVWESLQPTSRLRTGAAALTLAGRLFLCGGHDQHCVHDTVEVFDPDKGVWQEAHPMLQRRSGSAGVKHCRVLRSRRGSVAAFAPHEQAPCWRLRHGTHFVIYCLIFWCCQTAEKMNVNSVPTMPRRDASFSVSSGSLSHVFHQIYAFVELGPLDRLISNDWSCPILWEAEVY